MTTPPSVQVLAVRCYLATASAALVALAAAAGCASPAPPAPPRTEHAPAPGGDPAASTPAPAAAVDRRAGMPCLPLVSGCGCSYACAEAVHQRPDGAYDVTWYGQDSATLRATLGRLCLPDGRCREAFEDGSPCGGECIPTDEHLGCHRDARGACVP